MGFTPAFDISTERRTQTAPFTAQTPVLFINGAKAMRKKATLKTILSVLLVSIAVTSPLHAQKGKKSNKPYAPNYPGATLVFADGEFDAIGSDGQGAYVDGVDGYLDWDFTNSRLDSANRGVYFDFSNQLSGSGAIPPGTPGVIFARVDFWAKVGTVPAPGQTVECNASMNISIPESDIQYAVVFYDYENETWNAVATGVDIDGDGTTDAIQFTISEEPSYVWRTIRTETKGNRYTSSSEPVGSFSLPFSALLIKN